MGPRQWSRGRDLGSRSTVQPSRSFNGATAMEPWKSRAAITILERELRLQWGHGNGAVEEIVSLPFASSVLDCFNGATAMEPWKRRMGLGCTVGQNRCFNGATAMEPWKSKLHRSLAKSTIRLQWGHGNGAVEELRSAVIAKSVLGSFNGATAMEPWKSTRRSRICERTAPLQW